MVLPVLTMASWCFVNAKLDLLGDIVKKLLTIVLSEWLTAVLHYLPTSVVLTEHALVFALASCAPVMAVIQAFSVSTKSMSASQILAERT